MPKGIGYPKKKKKKSSGQEVGPSTNHLPTMMLRGSQMKGLKKMGMDEEVEVKVKGKIRMMGRDFENEPMMDVEMSDVQVTPAKKKAFMKAMKEA